MPRTAFCARNSLFSLDAAIKAPRRSDQDINDGVDKKKWSVSDMFCIMTAPSLPRKTKKDHANMIQNIRYHRKCRAVHA